MLQGMVWRLFVSRQAGKAKDGEEAAGEAGKGDDEPALWVPALTAYGPVLAQMVILTARLNDEGVPARLRSEAVSSALPLTVGALSRIDLMVPQPMVEKAILILKSLGAFEGTEKTDDHASDTGTTS